MGEYNYGPDEHEMAGGTFADNQQPDNQPEPRPERLTVCFDTSNGKPAIADWVREMKSCDTIYTRSDIADQRVAVDAKRMAAEATHEIVHLLDRKTPLSIGGSLVTEIAATIERVLTTAARNAETKESET